MSQKQTDRRQTSGDIGSPDSARLNGQTADSSLSVTMVATPDDGSCGIGAYAGDLMESFEGATARTVAIDQEVQTPSYFLSLALQAMSTDDDVVHVQHEYGLFRRDGSRWAGILGLVFFPALYLLNLIRGKVVVVTLHSVLKPAPEEAPLAVRLYLRAMHVLIASGADHLVFLSEGCARRFREDVSLSADEYSVLPHGVKVQDAAEESTESSKRRLGFDPDDRVVMIPGYIRPPKGHDIFVEVAEQLPEYEFLVAGGARPKGEDQDYAQDIEESAPENVTVTGVLDDEEFPRVLNAADLAFLPYRVVTQSGTFNWCAAQSIPVLASREDYFTRLAEEWGCVETVDIEDTDAVAARISDLFESESRLRSLQERMRAYRRQNSFRRVGAMHRQIYEWEQPSRSANRTSNRITDPTDD